VTTLSVLVALAAAAAPQESPAARVNRIMADSKFSAAISTINQDHDRLVADIVTLTEIPAPSFKETARGDAYLRMFTAAGLSDVERDPEGNVMGVRRGTGGGPLVAIAAHLDTVFPEGTDVKVKRQGTRLSAPGVGDNSRSLAVLLAMIRAMDTAGIKTTGDILFVGDVGEEGLGDLRGMKYLFTKGRYKGRITQFIALDGSGPGGNIVTGAVGSKRYLVTFNGPGGHSFGAFGLVSPAFAMAEAMQRLGTIPVPSSPKTTFNVGRVGGGTSVNSIPKDMWMEVDMRSESPLELEKIETAFLTLVKTSVADENRARSTADGAITADVKLIGARPSGQTPNDAPLVRMAAQAATSAGLQPTFAFSSTDANLAISLGIPAIRLESGGTGDRAHAPDEWIDVERTASVRGIRVVLATLLAMAGMIQAAF
jgi:acetylornithine deacetylase/succinyl-diaminopimelate desuccinylase-like protein